MIIRRLLSCLALRSSPLSPSMNPRQSSHPPKSNNYHAHYILNVSSSAGSITGSAASNPNKMHNSNSPLRTHSVTGSIPDSDGVPPLHDFNSHHQQQQATTGSAHVTSSVMPAAGTRAPWHPPFHQFSHQTPSLQHVGSPITHPLPMMMQAPPPHPAHQMWYQNPGMVDASNVAAMYYYPHPTGAVGSSTMQQLPTGTTNTMGIGLPASSDVTTAPCGVLSNSSPDPSQAPHYTHMDQVGQLAGDQPVVVQQASYVNAKQYERIMKRRVQRARREMMYPGTALKVLYVVVAAVRVVLVLVLLNSSCHRRRSIILIMIISYSSSIVVVTYSAVAMRSYS